MSWFAATPPCASRTASSLTRRRLVGFPCIIAVAYFVARYAATNLAAVVPNTPTCCNCGGAIVRALHRTQATVVPGDLLLQPLTLLLFGATSVNLARWPLLLNTTPKTRRVEVSVLAMRFFVGMLIHVNWARLL
jgi:hypothetical protein